MLHANQEIATTEVTTQAALDRFWQMVDHEKMQAEFIVDKNLMWLKAATIDQLRAICVQYRCFTEFYASDLSVLVAKLPYGQLKSMLAEIVSEELGSGDYANCHLTLWDNFIASIGVSRDKLHIGAAFPECREVLDELRTLVYERSVYYGVGLRGMVGECLCQVYLMTMYHHLKEHPYMVENKATIDWDFWTIHAGEEDIRHRELLRRTIGELVASDPSCIDELAEGYAKGKWVWERFWEIIYSRVGQQDAVSN